MFSNGTAISSSLLKLPYDPIKDFVPVSTMAAYLDELLLTTPKGPLNSVADILAQAKKRQLIFGTVNPGSTQNLSALLFKSTTGLNATVVPFKTTSQVIAALIRGDVDVAFETYAAVKGFIDAGKIRPIATSGTKRSSWLPKVPTVLESGVHYDVTGWNAIFAPAGVPAEAVNVLNQQLNAVLSLPEVRQRFQAVGIEARGSTPAAVEARLQSDTKKWAAVVKQAGIPQQ